MKYYTMSKDFIKIYIIWRYKEIKIHDQLENITKAKYNIILVTANRVLQVIRLITKINVQADMKLQLIS